MKEVEFLHKLTADLYNGCPWIDVNISNTLADIDASRAVKKYRSLNSIWQIVFHMVAWRETLLERLKGKEVLTPENNFFVAATDASETAWGELQKRLSDSQSELDGYFKNDVEDLYEMSAEKKFTRFELINGILQHDSYHLGQIVLIKKLFMNEDR